MTDTDTTEADTDTPAADVGGAVEILRLMPPTAWEAMLVLGKIATDPKAYRKALRGLHDAAVTTTAAQDAREKALDAREKEFEARIAKETAETEQLKKTAGDIWKNAQARERAVERREQAVRERGESSPARGRHPDDDGWTAPAGSGMSRTFTAPRTVRHDDLGQPYAAHTTLTRTTDAE